MRRLATRPRSSPRYPSESANAIHAGAKKLDIGPLEAAFDSAPWDDKLATEEEEEAMREVRAAETGSTAAFLPGAEVTVELAERARLK